MNSTYFLNRSIDDLFEASEPYWVGISSTAPKLDGTNVTEPTTTGTGYARVQLTGLGTAVDGVKASTTDISLPLSTASWGANPYTHYVVFDAQTGGHALFWGELTPHRTIEENTTLTFRAGDIKVWVANPTA